MDVSVAYKIRAHLANLAPGAIISSQGLIHLGPRGALDMALSRLNHTKRIRRKAWGVYVNTPDGEDYYVAPQTLAEAKAQAFNKTTLPFGKTIAHLLQFPPKVPESATVESSGEAQEAISDIGCKTFPENVIPILTGPLEPIEKESSEAEKPQEKVFKLYGTGSGVNIRDLGNFLRIKCVPLSPKKARNYPLEGCYWVNAVRYMGREYFYKNWKKLLDKLPPFRTSLNSLRDSFVLMPEWLYSNLCINWLSGNNRRKHQLIDISERIDYVPREHLDIIWGPGFRESDEIDRILF